MDLYYKTIDFSTAKLIIFVNRFFANNKDQSSQIGHVIIIGNKYSYTNTNEFTIKKNLIYWSLIKCRHMTQSILTSEIYGMVNKFNLGFVIK